MSDAAEQTEAWSLRPMQYMSLTGTALSVAKGFTYTPSLDKIGAVDVVTETWHLKVPCEDGCCDSIKVFQRTQNGALKFFPPTHLGLISIDSIIQASEQTRLVLRVINYDPKCKRKRYRGPAAVKILRKLKKRFEEGRPGR